MSCSVTNWHSHRVDITLRHNLLENYFKMMTMHSPTVKDFDRVNIPWFATEQRIQPLTRTENNLPADPRDWSRDDVRYWVETVCVSHHLPVPGEERFMMNGKAMCLMSAAMFTNRLPVGGKTLYREFQLRLARALNNC